MHFFSKLTRRRASPDDSGRQPQAIYKDDGSDRLLPRFGLFMFDHARVAALAWLLLAVFGGLSYAVFMQREGFPSVNIPLTLVNGAYLVNDPAKVDKEVARPLSQLILQDTRVKSVTAQSRGSFYSLTVQYKDSKADAGAINRELDRRIKAANVLPKQANYQISAPKFGFTERGDNAVVAVYGTKSDTSQAALKAEAQKVVDFIHQKRISGVSAVSVVDPFVRGTDVVSGQPADRLTKFDRYGVRGQGETRFYPAISVGLMLKNGEDVIKIDDHLRDTLGEYNARIASDGFVAVVSASYAPDIKAQISELQRSLLEGLLAVLVVCSLLIAVRASLITVLSMITVLAITCGVLFLAGYTLNTITLFSLILCLGLVVDDTIIMVEALDAQRRRLARAREVVRVATRKVSRAMVAATLTAALSFTPLLFVSGVLGGFIRAIPVTVIVSLLVSLFVALVFIPLFARYLLLGPKQLGKQAGVEPGARLEDGLALLITAPMVWARHSRRKILFVGVTAVVVGLVFIAAGGALFRKVTFNIFPPSKDTNGLTVTMQYDPGTTIGQAQTIADRANQVVSKTLGSNFASASYYEQANDQKSELFVELVPYNQRKARSPELKQQLQTAFNGFSGARVVVGQQDVGPPPSDFTVRIASDDRPAAMRLAHDMRVGLYSRQLERSDGTTAVINDVRIADDGTYSRYNGKAFVAVHASFDATDTSTLVELAKKAVSQQFDARKVASYGLPKDAVQYDIGQEQDNQDSFKVLALAFPLVLLAIYILLAFQFRSLLQPLLIFMAIPFSLLGITLGLYLTNNAFSFFSLLGFFALIGLSLKNSILLTDYANQLRRQGHSAVESAVGALQERFRPLVATSLTAVVSLIPLAIASPFWEGLAVVLICGLLSSTFMVITVFPYYYLGAEFLRLRVRPVPVLVWMAGSAALAFVIFQLDVSRLYAVLAALLVGLLVFVSVRRIKPDEAA